MRNVEILVAGTGFAAVRHYLGQAIPEARLNMVPAKDIRRDGARADVLIPAMSRIDAELMDRVAGLRLIQQWGAGLEGVDMAAATARGIPVANVPSAVSGNADSVAEWCVMAAIAVSRQLATLKQVIAEGSGWGGPIGTALMGRTATIVGLGGIGRALAARLRPFGMRLLGIRRQPDPAQAVALGLEAVHGLEELPTLLTQSDYLFLCLPLNERTAGLIDGDAISLMPAHGCIINPGRGGLLDERALLAAVEAGTLMGAALDVFANEPLDPQSPLLKHPRILATPHIAGVTDVSYGGIGTHVAENVRRVLDGQIPHHCANESAFQ